MYLPDKNTLLQPILIGFCLIILPGVLTAQDFRSSLERMRAKYEEVKDLHVEMQVEVFASPGKEESLLKLPVDVRKKGSMMAYEYGQNHMLLNSRYLIIVDGDSEEIICQERDEDVFARQSGMMAMNIDSILSYYGQPEYLGREGKLESYRITQQAGPVSEMLLTIDSERDVIREIHYTYREGTYVQIVFSRFDTDPRFPEDTFSEAKFIQAGKNGLVPASRYSGYHLALPEGHIYNNEGDPQ
ncbi:MAG: hypothetical protein WBB45_07570 [Cyclobacteriaceae bacterium]